MSTVEVKVANSRDAKTVAVGYKGLWYCFPSFIFDLGVSIEFACKEVIKGGYEVASVSTIIEKFGTEDPQNFEVFVLEVSESVKTVEVQVSELVDGDKFALGYKGLWYGFSTIVFSFGQTMEELCDSLVNDGLPYASFSEEDLVQQFGEEGPAIAGTVTVELK